MSEIAGMLLYATNESGKKVEQFKVQWVGQLAFGIINEHSTDRQYLELHSKEFDKLQAEVEQLKAELTCANEMCGGLQENIERLKKELREKDIIIQSYQVNGAKPILSPTEDEEDGN